MNDIIKLRNKDRLTREIHKLELKIPKPNQATFGNRSLRTTVRKHGISYPII